MKPIIRALLVSKLGLFAAFIEYLIAEEHENTADDKHPAHQLYIAKV